MKYQVFFLFSVALLLQGNNFQSADAGGTCVDPYVPAWQRADAFIRPRLGFPTEIDALSGLICPSGQVVNNYRSVSVDKTEGTVSVNETYLAMTGTGGGYEDFQINTSQGLGEPYITITVDGSVKRRH